jgi:hypothetical protein
MAPVPRGRRPGSRPGPSPRPRVRLLPFAASPSTNMQKSQARRFTMSALLLSVPCSRFSRPTPRAYSRRAPRGSRTPCLRSLLAPAQLPILRSHWRHSDDGDRSGTATTSWRGDLPLRTAGSPLERLTRTIEDDPGAVRIPAALHPKLQLVAERGRGLLARLTDKTIRQRISHTAPDLVDAMEGCLAAHNRDPQPFNLDCPNRPDPRESPPRGRITHDAIVTKAGTHHWSARELVALTPCETAQAL